MTTNRAKALQRRAIERQARTVAREKIAGLRKEVQAMRAKGRADAAAVRQLERERAKLAAAVSCPSLRRSFLDRLLPGALPSRPKRKPGDLTAAQNALLSPAQRERNALDRAQGAFPTYTRPGRTAEQEAQHQAAYDAQRAADEHAARTLPRAELSPILRDLQERLFREDSAKRDAERRKRKRTA